MLSLAAAAPAADRPEVGQTSSASVGISVSVAPTYRLRSQPVPPGGLRPGIDGQFCLASNARAASLPILLVAPAQDPSPEAVRTLSWCGPRAAAGEGDQAPVIGAGRTLIIRPE